MLNFFKNLFGAGTTETQANGDGNGYATTTAPTAPVQVRARTVPQSPQRAPEPPMQRPAPVRPMRPAANGNGVQVPLYTVIAVLPLELKTRIRQTMVADIFITLPLEQVLTQLGTGSVKMSFGDLRNLVPDVFTTQMDLDQTEIALPLNEILPQINPAMLARRESQRHVAVPEDVHGPFGNDLSGVTLADPRTAGRVTGSTAAPAPEPQPMPDPIAREPRFTPPPVAPAPRPPMAMPPKAPTPFTLAPLAPRAPLSMNSVPMNPAPKPPAPRPPAPMNPVVPMNPIAMTPPPPARPSQPIQPVRPVTPIQPIQFTPPAAPAHAPAPQNDPDPIPMVPFRSTLSSSPTPRPPTATPPASPPVRPTFPLARAVGATPLPSTASRLPSAPSNGNGNGNGYGRPTVPHAPQAAPATPEVFLSVPLGALTDSWPEVLREEIVQLNLSEAHLALPVRIVEASLKQGKIAFSWKMMRSWIRPAALPTVSAHDGMMLELPLRVIAPLFIARQKQGASVQQKVQVNEKIPNLFFGFPQPDSAPAAVEPPAAVPFAPAPTMAPVEEPEANFAPAPKSNAIADTNFYVWNETGEAPEVDESAVKKTSPGTDFLTRHATPNEVVARASALEGVAGALVALPDGLMVASKLSPDLNGDTLAAFLPHIFGKVSQCTKELRMGELNNLHFTVGNIPWKIFRVNAIFFAAFGTAGQPLPTAQLALLAAQLDRKK